MPPWPRRARQVSCAAVPCAACGRESRLWPPLAAWSHRRRTAPTVSGGRVTLLGSFAVLPDRRALRAGHRRQRAARGGSLAAACTKQAPIRSSERRSPLGGVDAFRGRPAAGSRAIGTGGVGGALEMCCGGRGGCVERRICVGACRGLPPVPVPGCISIIVQMYSSNVNPLPTPGNRVGTVHGLRGSRSAP